MSENDESTISQIEEFGCSVVSVEETDNGPGWSYTIGVFDMTGKPEIIAVGLLPETAHLQAIYPDLENQFPGDEGVDPRFQQPLMQLAAPMTRVEDDFWASMDPRSSLFSWKFPDPPHTGVYLSESVAITEPWVRRKRIPEDAPE